MIMRLTDCWLNCELMAISKLSIEILFCYIAILNPRNMKKHNTLGESCSPDIALSSAACHYQYTYDDWKL